MPIMSISCVRVKQRISITTTTATKFFRYYCYCYYCFLFYCIPVAAIYYYIWDSVSFIDEGWLA